MSEIVSPALGLLRPLATAEFSGIRASIMLGGPAAAMTAMRLRIQENCGAPTHISASEDKFFAVTGGRLLFLVGTEVIDTMIGDYVFVPKGVAHSFRAEGGTAWITLVSTPGRHDRFFQAMAALPTPHDAAAVEAVCTRFDQQMIGPIVA